MCNLRNPFVVSHVTIGEISRKMRLLIGMLAVACLAAPASQARTVEVRNARGSVNVFAVPGSRLEIGATGRERDAKPEDTVVRNGDTRVVVDCDPEDGATVDLRIGLPLGYLLSVETISGDVAISGLVRMAHVSTETGRVLLAAPWKGTSLRVDSQAPIERVDKPIGMRFDRVVIDAGDHKIWRLASRADEGTPNWGTWQVKSRALPRLVLKTFTVPPDSPVQFPWKAEQLLEKVKSGRRLVARPSDPGAPQEQQTVEPETLTFRTDVRMVNLTVPVYDRNGRPVVDLAREDFTVREGGIQQEVHVATTDDAPLNLAILLDLSGSTARDRDAMKQAALRFAQLAREGDRVGIYAIAESVFHTLAPLSEDIGAVRATLAELPALRDGGSPLYDSILLAYAQAFGDRPYERNALVVISDGLDNRISKQNAPSSLKIGQLVRAADQMHAILYPIYLRSAERFNPKWVAAGREALETLSAAMGGRVFPANSIQDLEPVFPLVERELRGVYSVGYYPKNQEFEGEWREVVVDVKRKGLEARARPGYFAY